MSGTTSSRYELFSTQQTKKIILVVKIDGLGDVLTSAPLRTRVLYGDPGLVYGQPGLFYGGLRDYVDENGDSYRDILSLEGSLMLSQKLEPESGKASISNLTLNFVDKDSFMTQLISPGVILPEILGREVQVFLGYAEISYPQDYVQIFRGFIASCESSSGMVNLQISDPNLKRKQQLFYTAKTKLTSSVTSSATSFPVASGQDFHSPILGPDGTFDPAIKCFYKIEDEWIRGQAGPGNTLGGYLDPDSLLPTSPQRGARGTTAAAHNANVDVQAGVEITDSAINMALKIMLSGWNGPWKTGVKVLSFGIYPDDDPYTNTTVRMVLPSKVDAVRDYGLVKGDYIYVSGSDVESGANNTPNFQIDGFEDLGDQTNRVILVSGGTLFKEFPTNATLSFRSQFDTYPVSCGMKLTPKDVDVERHIYIRDTFLGVSASDYSFFIIDTEDSGKSFIEEQVYRPVGMYSLTRRGLVSCGYTKPPLATSDLIFLNADNILDPQSIKPSRAVNGRSFYNEIDFYYDANDEGDFTSNLKVIDSESESLIGISQSLKIESRGLKSSNMATTYLNRIAKAVMSRFKRGMVVLPVKVSWGIGNTIEAGDVVALEDNGDLQIPNFETGERKSGTKLYEVLEKSLDIKSGNVSLKLTSVVGASITDRHGVISPSSLIVEGSTATSLIIKDSFGAIFPGQEWKKWEGFVGQKILVHSEDWTHQAETTLNGFDPANPYILLVDALPFTPAADYIIDIARYDTGTDPQVNEVYKNIFWFLTPTVAVASGTSQTVFTVDVSDIGKFHIGSPVRVHSEDYTVDSGDEINILVKAVNTTTNEITVDTALGFTPAAGQFIDLIGFPDGGGPYRLI
jgi:hypothetical protein